MKLPVHVQTKAGLEYCSFINTEYFKFKKDGILGFFKDLCSRELNRIRQNLDYFLDDDDLSKDFKLNSDDPTGWGVYRELDDRFAILSHYVKRMKYETD